MAGIVRLLDIPELLLYIMEFRMETFVVELLYMAPPNAVAELLLIVQLVKEAEYPWVYAPPPA